MEVDPSLVPAILIAIAVAVVALVVFGVVRGLRPPPLYGPEEIARGSDNPTMTTIARRGLIQTSFFENDALVGKATSFGRNDQGIALRLGGDATEYLFTNDGDWLEETRFRTKPDIRLMLLADGVPIVTAERVPYTVREWLAAKDRKCRKLYVIDCAQGRFDFSFIKFAKYALCRDDIVLGIVAMSLLTGVLDRFKSRIELPALLPLTTRLFLALLVKFEDRDRLGSSSP